MNLRMIDLNLFVVLDALLEEAHVSRAASRLGLSQPATSNALDRCRQLFGDPLLQRSGGAMSLTPKAEALRAPIRNVIMSVDAALNPAPADLSLLHQTVRIAMADYPGASIVAATQQRLATSAPAIDLNIRPWRGAREALERLEDGTVDIAVSVFPTVSGAIRRELLVEERYQVIMRSGHPASESFDLDAWVAYPHLTVSGRGEPRGPIDEALARRGRCRRVGLVVPSFLMVLPLLRNSNLIAALPSRSVPLDQKDAFVMFEPPLPIQGFPLHLASHSRRAADAAVCHVIETIMTVFPPAD